MSNIVLELATSKEVVLATKQAFSKLAPVVAKNPMAVAVGFAGVGCLALYLYKSQKNVTNITINNYYF